MDGNESTQTTQATQATEFVPGVSNYSAPVEPTQEGGQSQETETQITQQGQTTQSNQEQNGGQETQNNKDGGQSQQKPAPFDYAKYLDNVIKQAEEESKGVQMPPQPTDDELANDDQALSKYFSGIVDAAVKKSSIENAKTSSIQQAENRAWEDVFQKYPEVKTSLGLRNTIHFIRVGAAQSGKAITPLEAADGLIAELHDNYKKGINANKVTETVRNSQPVGGSANSNRNATNQAVDYKKLQNGGEAAAIDELQKLMEQGKI